MTTPNSINWSDLIGIAGEATGATILPVAKYHVIVDKAAAAKTQNGKDQIKVQFRVASGPNQGKGPIYNQFVISPDSPNAMSFFFQHLSVFGITVEYLKTHCPTIAQIAQMMIGKQCMVTIGHGVWQGKPKMEVDKIEAVAGGVPGVPSGPPSTPPVASMPVPVPASTSNGAPAVVPTLPPTLPPTPEPFATATTPPEVPF